MARALLTMGGLPGAMMRMAVSRTTILRRDLGHAAMSMNRTGAKVTGKGQAGSNQQCDRQKRHKSGSQIWANRSHVSNPSD